MIDLLQQIKKLLDEEGVNKVLRGLALVIGKEYDMNVQNSCVDFPPKKTARSKKSVKEKRRRKNEHND